MKQNVCNNSDHDNVQLLDQQQQQPQLPDHLKCGEVYTWKCADELYAVECKLCEDRPLCPLSEFPQHMEIWHTDWEEPLKGKRDARAYENEDQFDDHHDLNDDDNNEELYLSITTDDSGLYEDDPQDDVEEDEQNQNLLQHDDRDVDILEPFEQVLIEQDNAVEINENEIEEKINKDKPEVEQTTEVVIAKNRQQRTQLNKNNSTDDTSRKEKTSVDHRENLREYDFLLNHSTRDSTYHDLVYKNLNSKKRDNIELNRSNDSANLKNVEKRITRSIKSQNNDTINSCISQEFSKFEGEAIQTNKQNKITEENEHGKESHEALTFKEATNVNNRTSKKLKKGNNVTSNTNDKQFIENSENSKKSTRVKNLIRRNFEQPQICTKRKLNTRNTSIMTSTTKRIDRSFVSKEKLNNNFLAVCNDSENCCDSEKNFNDISMENLKKSHNSWNEQQNVSLRVPKRKTRQSALKTKNKSNEELLKITDNSLMLCDLEDNFKDYFTKNPKKSHKVRNKSTRDNSMAANDMLNESAFKKYSYEPIENAIRTRSNSLRLLKESFLTSLGTKKKLRQISETSSDFKDPITSLTLENLKSNEHSLQQKDLRISESSIDLNNTTFNRDCEDLKSLNTMNIYDLSSPSSLENPSVTSCDAESSLSPESLSDSLKSHSFLSEEDKGISLFNCKQNLNNLFYPCSKIIETQPLTPQSPKTEEEHFEFYEPKEKLTKHHIIQLISLYKEHPRLWDQSHTEFCEPHLCRQSWQDITDKWNEYCKRKFAITEVRIRICTLCQRYLKERERLELEGELDESAKFPYYEEMYFLEQQKSLQKRRDLYDQQNVKVLEMFKHFPVLWHVGCYKLRQAKERTKAFQNISTALKLCGIHLSSLGVQKRLRSLKKCYRLEKIRYLHSQVEQTKFESTFKHFENMQFLDKHIDPFICRICGKIFENLSKYRDHLDTENHGSILGEDTESETETDQVDNEKCCSISKQNLTEQQNPAITNNIDIAEVPVATESITNSLPYLNDVTLYDSSPVINEVLIYPANSSEGQIFNTLQAEDEIIEEIMENVSMNDNFNTQSLDNFINSVNNCKDITFISNCINAETFPVTLMNIEIPNVQNEVIIDPTNNVEISNDDSEINVDVNKAKLSENHEMELAQKGNNYPSDITVNVQSEGYSLDLKLNTTTINENFENPTFDNEELISSEIDSVFARLPDSDIRKMIALYRKYPQLWNPNHLDYNSRNLRRQAWCDLTSEYCKLISRQFSWRTLHRKLADYAKYYKKLITDQLDYEETENKWTFFEDFKFLDDVIAVHNELQRSVHHRDNNFKIIGIYRSIPQLWDIKHADFNKRPIKQRNIEQMCYRLQEEYNVQITPERLKNRLIELRAQYRAAKKQRLKSVKKLQSYTPEFEFYEALNFLDSHIDPFMCDQCKMEFKKLTDFNQHQRKEHETTKKNILRQQPLSLTDHRDNICHICGIKFSSRSNLIHHVRRHEGVKNYECSLCTKKFFSSHSLKIHIRSHTKECPYTCEKCGVSFVSASKLNQHVKRHSNKKDFVCDYCPKAFFTAFERDRHVRRHLNIRDKICPICGKSFVVGSSYYAHMMLHNDTKRFSCDKCDMKFAQYAGLYKHKKRHHKT